jgi:2-phosphosulfolactate phosphatase
MQIDIQFPSYQPDPRYLSNRIVIVIDILRTTSVMVHAMSQGTKESIPGKTVEEAFQLAKTFPRNTTLVGGERESQRLEIWY